jgi:hypothetical protein
MSIFDATDNLRAILIDSLSTSLKLNHQVSSSLHQIGHEPLERRYQGFEVLPITLPWLGQKALHETVECKI